MWARDTNERSQGKYCIAAGTTFFLERRTAQLDLFLNIISQIGSNFRDQEFWVHVAPSTIFFQKGRQNLPASGPSSKVQGLN